jgi:hypothetical protein
MRRDRWVALVAALAAGASTGATLAVGSPPAAAQSVVSFLVGFGAGPGGAPRSVTDIQVQSGGQLVVTFAGDPASGCAAHGLCGYSGTLVVRPDAGGDMAVATYRHRGHTSYQVELFLGFGSGSAFTASHVVRTAGGSQAGTCADATQTFARVAATVEHGTVDVPLFQPGGTLLSNRCAGPRDGDLTSTGPRIELPVRRLMRGRSRLDLGGTWSFSSGGFSGTVRSTLALVLGRPRIQSAAMGSRFPKGIKTTEMRQLTETLTVTQAHGTLDLAVAGSSDPNVCQLLDSCGVAGTLSGVLLPQQSTAELTAFGPASRPYGDFLAALGVSRQGNPNGISVAGTVGWSRGGSVTARLGQSQSCTDTVPLGGGQVILIGIGGRLSASYEPVGPPVTRCPGPIISPNVTLGSGMIGEPQRGRRTLALRIDGRQPVDDDGYTVSSNVHLTFTLHRGSVSQQLLRVPTG